MIKSLAGQLEHLPIHTRPTPLTAVGGEALKTSKKEAKEEYDQQSSHTTQLINNKERQMNPLTCSSKEGA